MKTSVLKQELPEMQNRPLVLRLENWGRCLKLYVPGWSTSPLIGGDTGSAENRFSAAAHSGYRTVEANPASYLDVNDAKIIESGVTALPLYQHTLLKAWYVQRHPPSRCLSLAAKAGDRKRLKFSAFDAEMEMAHALLTQALTLPAVVRKVRARELVRELLA